MEKVVNINFKEFEDIDFEFVTKLLPRMKEEIFESLVNGKSGFIIQENNENKGILIFTILWEKIPFIQHLIISENERGKGIGTKAILEFENLMRNKCFKMVMLSTQVDEKAQFLYRQLGYVDNGAIFLENSPFDQPAELFLKKTL